MQLQTQVVVVAAAMQTQYPLRETVVALVVQV
jgi:hypothetical protein